MKLFFPSQSQLQSSWTKTGDFSLNHLTSSFFFPSFVESLNRYGFSSEPNRKSQRTQKTLTHTQRKKRKKILASPPTSPPPYPYSSLRCVYVLVAGTVIENTVVKGEEGERSFCVRVRGEGRHQSSGTGHTGVNIITQCFIFFPNQSPSKIPSSKKQVAITLV